MRTLRIALAAGIVLIATESALCQASGPAPGPPAVTGPAVGTLVMVDGNNLVLRDQDVRTRIVEEVTVATDQNTGFMVDAEPGKLADLRPGMQITVTLGPATATRRARVMVVASSRGLMGTVVKVDGNSVVVRPSQPGDGPKEVSVVTDGKTKVIFLGVLTPGGWIQEPRVGTPADLKADMAVNILPKTGTAAKILVARSSGARGGRATSAPASSF